MLRFVSNSLTAFIVLIKIEESFKVALNILIIFITIYIVLFTVSLCSAFIYLFIGSCREILQKMLFLGTIQCLRQGYYRLKYRNYLKIQLHGFEYRVLFHLL